MNNTVNPEKLRKAKIASCCFMGLGQILFLKQYIRGALYALVEVAMICAIVIGTKNIIPSDSKEAKYFENTRPSFAEMRKYFGSDEAKAYKSDSDEIFEEGASEFKDIIASNEGFLRQHGLYVVEKGSDLESVNESVKEGLKNFINSNSESLEKHNVYLSDELAVLLAENGESLSDHVYEYELESDVVEELKESYADNEKMSALLDKIQEKMDEGIFIAQVDLDDLETAAENIKSLVDKNNDNIEAMEDEDDKAFTAYAESLAASIPHVVEVDYSDVEALDKDLGELKCLPGEDENEFTGTKENIISAVDANNARTSKHLAKLMAKAGMENYADYKDEYEDAYSKYEDSIDSLVSSAQSKIKSINEEIASLNEKIEPLPTFYDDKTQFENKIKYLGGYVVTETVGDRQEDRLFKSDLVSAISAKFVEFKAESDDEKRSALYDEILSLKKEYMDAVAQHAADEEIIPLSENFEKISKAYEECLINVDELKKVINDKSSKISDVQTAEAELQSKFTELDDLFEKYKTASSELDASNAFIAPYLDSNDYIELNKTYGEKFAEFKDVYLLTVLSDINSGYEALKNRKRVNDQFETDIDNKKNEINSIKEAARSVIALYKYDFNVTDENRDAKLAAIVNGYNYKEAGKTVRVSGLDSIQNVFNNQVIDGVDDELKNTDEKSNYLFFGMTKDDVAEKILNNYRPTNPNAFDMNYDGCITCKMANDKGLRTTKHMAWGHGPIVSSLEGLFTLGHKTDIYPDTPETPMKYRDHSIFMMINGIFALIFIGFFVILYAMNIGSAKSGAEKIIKNGRFPTWQETKNDVSQNSFATIGISPSIILICVFSIIPLLFSALIAFTNYSSPDFIPPNNLVNWVGLESFKQMFSTTGVGGGSNAWAASFGWAAIWTLIWAVFATFTCFFVGFFYAFVLQDKRIIVPTFFRTVFILPYAIPTMLSLFVWANLLNGTIGPINEMLKMFGLPGVKWLSDPWIAKGTLIFVNIWIGFPYSMILTTSSMTAISNSLYEAAVIDGATKWQQFKNITYPLVMFQLKPTLIMQFAGNINNFGAVFFLTGGGPNLPGVGLTSTTSCGATDILISWIYKLTMNTPYRYNLASVLSLLVFVVLVPFALYNFTRTKSFKEGAV